MAAATEEESAPDYRQLAEDLKGSIQHNFDRDNTVNRILGTRTCEERQKICKEYGKVAYQKLENTFTSWWPSSYDKLVIQLCRSVPERDAFRARDALKGFGTDECSLACLLITKTPDEIKEMKEAYKKQFSALIEDDIRGDTSGDFRDFCLTLLRKQPEDRPEDTNGYVSCANLLYSSGESRIGTDSEKINDILINSKPTYLREVFKYFKEYAEKDIEDSLRSETSGCYQRALMYLIVWTRSSPEFYADMLHNALNGWWVNHRDLRTYIVDRCEIDLPEIKACYEKKYSRPLEDMLYVKTKGSYRDLLLTLITTDFTKKTQSSENREN